MAQDDALRSDQRFSRSASSGCAGPRSTRHEYPGARHEVFNETNSAEVLADVNAFIDSVLT